MEGVTTSACGHSETILQVQVNVDIYIYLGSFKAHDTHAQYVVTCSLQNVLPDNMLENIIDK